MPPSDRCIKTGTRIMLKAGRVEYRPSPDGADLYHRNHSVKRNWVQVIRKRGGVCQRAATAPEPTALRDVLTSGFDRVPWAGDFFRRAADPRGAARCFREAVSAFPGVYTFNVFPGTRRELLRLFQRRI